MHPSNEIVRQRQLAIRREMDRRGISLKAIAFDSGLPYPTLLTYFPAGDHAATISGSALFALCGVLPHDLISLLLPDGFQVVRVPEGVDHDTLADMASEYLAAKNAAHHPESEAGRDIGPGEESALNRKAVCLKVAA